MNYQRRNRTAGKWFHSERTSKGTGVRGIRVRIRDLGYILLSRSTTNNKTKAEARHDIAKEKWQFHWEGENTSQRIQVRSLPSVGKCCWCVLFFSFHIEMVWVAMGWEVERVRGWELLEWLIFPFSFSWISDTVAHITQPVKPVSRHPLMHPIRRLNSLVTLSGVNWKSPKGEEKNVYDGGRKQNPKE